MKTRLPIAAAIIVVVSQFSNTSLADSVYSENFTGTTTSNQWYFFNGACLTAGSTTSTSSPGLVPACTTVLSSYYALQTNADPSLVGGYSGYLGSSTAPLSRPAQVPDPTGNGALRFTNGYPYGHNESGAIISKDTFDTGDGVQITFKTVTYRGDSGGTGKDGADGISFFLMDGSQSPNIGAFGGSLGYTCSNSNNPHDGLVGGYLGLGIDEYGNFLNGTSLMSGYTGSNSATGDNSALGYGYKPGRIGLRGAGNIAWSWLNKTYPSRYPSTLTPTQQQDAVYRTCKDGVLYDYSQYGTKGAVKTSTSVLDYAPIPNAYKELSSVQIANESATTRSSATPIFYSLKITQDGLLSFSYSVNGGAYQSVIKNQSITASNGALPSSFRFGFAGSTGGSTNIHEIMCFKAAPSTQSGSSTTVNEKQAAKVEAGTQAYFAFYNPNEWTGRLTANSLIDTAGVVTVSTTANWDASCVLTGVASGKTCETTGVNGLTSAQSPTGRVMLTWDGSTGVPFEWSNITTAQQNTLDSGDTKPYTVNRLNYLRGVRTNEVNTSGVGLYRMRDSVLGDIVNSSPSWVGPPSSPYTATWTDRLTSASMPENSKSGQSYVSFVAAKQTRLNVVYAGSNDGFLHGFRAGSFDSSGKFVDNGTTPNDGLEVLAYMPAAVLNTIHNSSDSTLDYSNTQYGHNFFVDATPGTGDLFYSNAWHTWLVGGLGAGGTAIYALDITDPSSGTFKESNAANLVIGEWNSSTISCSNVSGCNKNLGNTFGTPQIRRLHSGNWGVIFGNGFGSANGDAGIFVMTVDQSSGAKTVYYLSTGKAGSNGIAYATPADLDGDHVTDYVYAGDLLGNVWRFDLTSNDPTKWAVSSKPLFTTNSGQPITSQLLVVSTLAAGGLPQLMIEFGTGQRTQLTNATPVSYVSGTQDLYGIWDWNLSAWNALTATAQYSSLAATTAATGLTSPYTLAQSNLQKQIFTVNVSTGVRDGTSTVVCWKGYTLCPSGNTKFGWYVDLPGSSEQIVYNPVFYQGAFIVDSTVPANNVPTSCTSNSDTGFTYAISIATGAVFTSAFPKYKDAIVAGIETDATGSPYIVTTAEGTTNLIFQTVSGTPGTQQVNIPSNTKAKRLTWIERR